MTNVTSQDVGGVDVPGDMSTKTVLTLGNPIDGGVDTSTDSDWYQVSLVAGQTYYFELNGSGASPLSDPSLTLYGMNYANFATSLVTNNNSLGTTAFLTYTAATSGTYYIAAAGYAFSQGHYTLNSGVMPADNIPGDQTTTAALTINQPTAGIATGNDADWYSVQLTAGVSYKIDLSATASGNIMGMDAGSFWVLSYSNGNTQYLASSSFSSYPSAYDPSTHSATAYFTPTTSGTYYIATQSADDSYEAQAYHINGGAYTVGVSTAPADIDASGPVNLAIGSSISSVISSGADTDTYHVDVVAGQTYVFYLTPTGDAPLSSYSFQINGQNYTGDIYNNNLASVHFTAPMTGTYSLVVDYSTDATINYGGTYTISAETLAADVAGNANTTGSVAIGGSVNGYIDSQTDSDWYAVTLKAGQTYDFTMSQRFTQYGNNSLNLVTASGNVLATGVVPITNTHDASIVYTATTSGVYYLAAGLGAGWPVGDYTLHATNVSDAQGATAATAQVLALGQVATGEVDYLNDKDWYVINGVSGATYSLDVYATGTDGIATPAVTIVDASGNTITGGTSTYSSGHLLYTPTNNGPVYINIGSYQNDSHGNYAFSTTLIDAVSGNVDTSASVAIGSSFSSTIDYGPNPQGYSADYDYIEVTLQAGQSYDFTVSGSGSVPTVPVLGLVDAYGNPIYTNLGGTAQHLQYYATQGGPYYLVVSSNNPYQTGGYTVTANSTTDVFDQTNTQTVLTVGASQQSTISSATDNDFFKVTLTAGQDYIINVSPNGANPIAASQVTLIGSDNNPVVATASNGSVAGGSEFRYTAKTSGTYYVDVSGQNGATGGYSVSATAVAVQKPVDTISSGHKVTNGAVSVYFATQGQGYDGHSAAQNWTSAQTTAFLAAASQWSSVSNVTFTQATTAANANLIVVLDASATGVTSISASGNTPEVAVFGQAGMSGTIAAGTSAYESILNVTGHALGLLSPYGWSATHEPMEGVVSIYDTGTAGLNSDLYTVMASTLSSGATTTPMALDVAAVQAMYGTVAHNAGDTTYTLPTSNPSTVSVIWDTGGTDTITVGSSTFGGIIDLRAATLTNTSDGGGHESYSYSGGGGFVIANGVTIENATGGTGNDGLTGNSAANVLNGGDGNDTIDGGLGNDTLIGGNGTDTLSFATATTAIQVDLSQTAAQDTHQGIKSISGFENVVGSAYNDTIKLAAGTAAVDGGAGTDTLVLSGNYASYTIAASYYGTTITDSSGDNYTIQNIEQFQFADKTLDFAHLTGVAPYITGDLTAYVADSGTYTLTTDDLNFVDPSVNVITYTANNILDGALYINGVAGTTFTSAQVAAGQVVFHESGGSTDYSAGFGVHASNGTQTDNGYSGMQLYIVHSPGQIINDTDAGTLIMGTAGNDVIFGNGGDDTIVGGLGNDTIDGGTGNNTVSYADATGPIQADLVYGISGSDGYDTLKNIQNIIGSNFDDAINGDTWNNTLNGGAGADSMAGGAGNDTYIVDNAGDVITEQPSQGIDSVVSSVSYALPANVEILTLTGTANLNATGNNLHNTLIGNSGNNILDGGAGADIMIGGAGNDTYVVDNVNDVVTENANEGIDTVLSSISYTLTDNVENLTLTGTQGLVATGNGLNNALTGSSGNDTLIGGAGSDTLDGGAGTNTAIFAFNSSAARIVSYNGAAYVEDVASGAVDQLTNVQVLQFADKTISPSVATPFDPYAYMASNPTLIASLKGDPVAAVAQYLTTGAAQHLATNSFDAVEYIASNPDLIPTFGMNTAGAAKQYVTLGYNQHRSLNSFDAWDYLASNPGLIAALGLSAVAAEQHYISYGYNEHRSTNSFDPWEYLASNPGLISALGANASAAEQHYDTYGYNEHRATNTFDAWEYLASNPGLIAGLGANASAAEQHYVQYGYNEHRATGSFDAWEYLASNPGLISALGANPAAAEQHYVQYGYNEHRVTNSFDAWEYLASNPGLVSALGANASAAEQHYDTYGYNEHRATNTFDAWEYLASNPGLIATVGANPSAAAQQYVTTGINAHTATNTFDPWEYLASNPGLISALGANASAAEQHYVQYGYNEHRATSTFNAAQYLANYPDLQAAYGHDLRAAEMHYVLYGYNEHRTDHPL